jgi:hypothetical protein
MAVCLHQHERHPSQRPGEADGAGYVATGAEHHVGRQLADQPHRVAERAEVDGGGARGLGRAPAGERRHLQRAQLVSGFGHQLALEAIAAGEHHLGTMITQHVGDGDRRHDVSGGPADADHDPRPGCRLRDVDGRERGLGERRRLCGCCVCHGC